MATIEKSVDVNVPLHTAYNQWTQFEQFPQFMEGIEQVRQLDDQHLHWRAKIAGKTTEWDAQITEQIPDRAIGWRSISGAQNDGMVSFEPLGPNQTRVNLRLEYDPEGLAENLAAATGLVSRRVSSDLKKFKEFIEARGHETGGWRGEIDEGRRAA